MLLIKMQLLLICATADILVTINWFLLRGLFYNDFVYASISLMAVILSSCI